LTRVIYEPPRADAAHSKRDDDASRSSVAQKPIPVIGYLGLTSPGPGLAAFRQGLKTGYFDGQDRNDRIPLGGGPL
jgi:hypothetical protein